jgi:hypothetical protein
MYTSRIENPMVVGAAAQYDAMCAIGERLEAATESELEQLLADEGSVEEAISQNADLVRVAIDELAADPSRGARFARSAREAFGHSLDFRRPRDPDFVVGVICTVGAFALLVMILAGVA